jgi:uncharacterized protein
MGDHGGELPALLRRGPQVDPGRPAVAPQLVDPRVVHGAEGGLLGEGQDLAVGPSVEGGERHQAFLKISGGLLAPARRSHVPGRTPVYQETASGKRGRPPRRAGPPARGTALLLGRPGGPHLDLAREGVGREGEEVDDHRRHVLGLEAPGRRLRSGPSSGMAGMAELGLDAPGEDRSHPHAALAEVEHGGLGHPQKTELAGVVGGAAGHRVLAGERGDVDDPARAARLEKPRRGAQAVEGAEQVGLDDLPEGLARELVDRAEGPDAGVVDQEVEPAALGLGHRAEEEIDLALVPDVDRPAGHRAAALGRGGGELRDRRLDRLGAPAAEVDPPALAQEGLHNGAADAAGAAGDDRDSACFSRTRFFRTRHASTSRRTIPSLPGQAQGPAPTTLMGPWSPAGLRNDLPARAVFPLGKEVSSPMFFFDPSYFVFILPALLLSLWAGWRTRSAFRKYSQVRTIRGLTGAQAAQEMLRGAGITDVQVVATAGLLTDHYNPANKTLNLSEEVYASSSVAAVGVACHEAGHALQHAAHYAPLGLRSALVPTANLGSSLGLIIMGLGLVLLRSPQVVLFGALLFSCVLLFQIVTLPVEFDATARAKRLAVQQGIVLPQEREGMDRVLNAAALTYVAAVLSTLMTLLYYLLRSGLVGGGRRS